MGGLDLHAAATELGVHYQTAYRWVRDGRLDAVKVRSTYEITTEEVRRFLEQRALPVPPPRRSSVRDWQSHVARLLPALLQGDDLAAWNLVERLATRGVPVIDICEQLISPAMVHIGNGWHEGRYSIAVEHRASAIVERLIARITPHPRGRPRGTAVVAAAPGDLHHLPTAMAALVLREDHWKVQHLGVDLDENELVSFIEGVQATLAVLSAATPEGRARALDLSARLQPSGVHVLCGGPNFTLRQLIEQARELPHH